MDIDPNVAAIICGLIANALTSFAAKFGTTITGDIAGDNSGTLAHVHGALDELSETFDWNGPGRLEEVCLFLSSPEAEGIVRQIYAANLFGKDTDDNLALIRKEFGVSLAHFIDERFEQLERDSNELFESLLHLGDKALSFAIEQGVLSAHESASKIRHRILVGELDSIQKKLDAFTNSTCPLISDVQSYESQLRKQVINRHQYIIPPHFDTAIKVAIKDLYVCPEFERKATGSDESVDSVEMYKFLSSVHRQVVLGNPGGGKSTFASRVCYDLASQPDKRIFANRKLTPLLVVLRDYGAEKQQRNTSILEYIEQTCKATYQIPAGEGIIEYMLLNGRALVVFDGLDELIDTRDRQRVSGDIESFCNLYPEVPVIVTSRQVGYDQAPLDPESFEVAQLAPLGSDQVRKYVTNWFGLDRELNHAQRQEKVDSFLAESESVPDLCSNPLMLGLMCNLYRGENYIPKNRPDLYEKCAVMLFERWDKSRGIKVELPFEAHIRPAMMHLAHWIFTKSELQSGVTQAQLVAATAKYLTGRRFEDPDEAFCAANTFIEFCRGRAWVFTDTGTTGSGESLYQFTHRTFLEYFAAAHLVRIHHTPARLSKVLLPRICNSEWDVVAQLAFQIQNKHVEGAGDALLDYVLKAQNSRKRGVWNLHSFAVRCLEFMIPSPAVSREIVRNSLEGWIAWARKEVTATPFKNSSAGDWTMERADAIFDNLAKATVETVATIEGEVKDFLARLFRQGDDLNRRLAMDLLCGPLKQATFEALDPESWKNCRMEVKQDCSTEIREICQKCVDSAILACMDGTFPMTELVDCHGFDVLFEPLESRVTGRMYAAISTRPILELIAATTSGRLNQESLSHATEQLSKLGQLFDSATPPFQVNSMYRHDLFESHWWFEHRTSETNLASEFHLTGDAWFAAFLDIAISFEIHNGSRERAKTLTKAHSVFHSICSILLQRHPATCVLDWDELKKNHQLTSHQISTIRAWVEGELHFVASEDSKT